jgi:ferredoxin
MVMASKDAVALDAVAASVIGIDPADVEMVRIAHERGLGVIDPKTVGNARGAIVRIKSSLIGKVMPYMEDAWTNQRLNRIAHPLAKRFYGGNLVPLKEARKEMDAIDPSRIAYVGDCSQCGLCVNACPTKNIALGDKPALDSKCIKCFICVEICPNGVLAIQRK